MRVHFSKRVLAYFTVIDVVLIFSALWFFSMRHGNAVPVGLEGFEKGGLRLTSPAFGQNGPIPVRFACVSEGGDNVSPPLSISGVPSGTKSLALVVEDPDAPFGIWTHWTIWNLSPHLSELREGAVPDGAMQGPNSSRDKAYGGPCPPQGAHRYFFKLYALDAALQVSEDIDSHALQQAIVPHMLGQAVLVGTFRKP